MGRVYEPLTPERRALLERQLLEAQSVARYYTEQAELAIDMARKSELAVARLVAKLNEPDPFGRPAD